ncbi:unnamed protein product [Rotaria sp. Silwood2]|nr:unnamed protein product [Rotaria sp. Silwood2]
MKIFICLNFILCWIIYPVYPFGHSLLPLFSLDRSYININHGSYGSAPKYVHEKLHEYQLQAERNPDRWYRLDVQVAMKKLREKLSKYVNCDPDDLVILDNASAAINSIFKSIKLKSNETIIYYSTAYRMVKLTLQYISTEIFSQEQIIQIELDHQTIQNTNLLLEKTQDTINKLKKC